MAVFLLGLGGVWAGAPGPAGAQGTTKGAAAASGSAGVVDSRPGGHNKPPVRMLEQTLMLGSGSSGESVGTVGSWGEVRTAIAAEFKPTAELITAESKPLAAAKQLTRVAPMSAGAPTLAGAAAEPTGEIDPVGQADAARQVYERPANIRTVELAATVEADGRVSAVQVLMPSGSGAFDDAAVAAVRRGLRDRASAQASEQAGAQAIAQAKAQADVRAGVVPDSPANTPAGVQPGLQPDSRVVVRLRISAGRAITLPRVVPLREPPQQNARQPPTRGLLGTGSFAFDETTGAVHAEPPFSNRLNSQVELISVTPARPVVAHPAAAASPAPH